MTRVLARYSALFCGSAGPTVEGSGIALRNEPAARQGFGAVIFRDAGQSCKEGCAAAREEARLGLILYTDCETHQTVELLRRVGPHFIPCHPSSRGPDGSLPCSCCSRLAFSAAAPGSSGTWKRRRLLRPRPLLEHQHQDASGKSSRKSSLVWVLQITIRSWVRILESPTRARPMRAPHPTRHWHLAECSQRTHGVPTRTSSACVN